MKILNKPLFFDLARGQVFPGRITHHQLELLEPLLAELERWTSISDEAGAYILATADHETAHFSTLEEIASGDAYEGRVDLGNAKKGDGRRFKGRGYVQITGRANYAGMSLPVGRDLVADPTAASKPEIAALIICFGMMDGSFTGLSLPTFVNASKVDYINARKVVNALDRAEEIAARADRYLSVIREANNRPLSSIPKPPLSAPPMPETDNPVRVPARRKPRFGQAVACGTSITVIWTAIAGAGWLPPALAEPQVTAAIAGVLSSLASAFGLCNFFRPHPSSSSPEGR